MKAFLIEAVMGFAIVLALLVVGGIIGFILYNLGFFPDIKQETNKKLQLGRKLAIVVGFAYLIEAPAKMMHFGPMVEKWDQFSMTYLLSSVGVAEFFLVFFYYSLEFTNWASYY